MSQVWELVELSQSETLVLLALADHADDTGRCWPSIARVARKARLQRRGTQAIIRRLENKGFIKVSRPGIGDGASTNIYQLCLGVHEIHPTGAPDDTKGCTPRPGGVHRHAPESSVNHQEPKSDKKSPMPEEIRKKFCGLLKAVPK